MQSRFNSLVTLTMLLVGLPAVSLAVDLTKPQIQPLVVTPPSLAYVGTVTPTPYGGMETKGWVKLSAPAAADVNVGLTPSNLQLVEYPFPSGARVLAGQTVGNFTFRPKPVTAPTQLIVTARIGQQQESKAINYTILPPVLLSMSLNATNVVGGGFVQGTATFSGPPASASSMWAKLSSNNTAAATVPAKAMLEVGKTVAAFAVETLAVSNDTPVTISASTGSTYPTTGSAMPYAAVKVLPAPLKEVRGYPMEGWPVRDFLTVALDGPAGPGGAVIQLLSSDPAVFKIPKNVTIPSQQPVISVEYTKEHLSSDTWGDISATYRGVTMKYRVPSDRLRKPDLVIKSVSLQDRFGNPITSPQDSQPFKICIGVGIRPDNHRPTYPPPASLLEVGYRQPASGGTSIGRAWNISVSFSYTEMIVTPCTELPGLAVGSYYDVTLKADVTNLVVEENEGNNSKSLRISR